MSSSFCPCLKTVHSGHELNMVIPILVEMLHLIDLFLLVLRPKFIEDVWLLIFDFFHIPMVLTVFQIRQIVFLFLVPKFGVSWAAHTPIWHCSVFNRWSLWRLETFFDKLFWFINLISCRKNFRLLLKGLPIIWIFVEINFFVNCLVKFWLFFCLQVGIVDVLI